LQRVVALFDACAQNTALGLGRGFEALTCDVKFPAVKWTTQAIAFVASKGQIGASVWAVAVEQTKLTLRIFEQDQILAQQPNRFDGSDSHAWIELGVELVHQGNRVPVMA
jgi:hypothetical protein